jgi:hypothetical protein
MNVELAEERILLVADRFNMDVAEGRAWAKRVEAFGALARLGGLLQKPKDEDYQLVYRERRLQPFWRLAATALSAYVRNREYRIRLEAEVQSVEIGGATHAPTGGELRLPGVETCRQERRREWLFDGLTHAEQPQLAAYLAHDAKPVSADVLNAETAAGAVIVPPAARASMLTREALAQAISRVEADRMLEEKVTFERIDLYYRPVYAFRYKWQNKEAVIEFDAATGETRLGGATFETHVGKLVDPAFLLDIGAEAANMFIPGVNLAKIMVVKGMQMQGRGQA